MVGVEPDAAELRVVGCLVEKQRTTPDQYPLTLNSLRLACNQSTNREPIVDYDDATIRSAIDRLTRRKWATLASWSTARSVKYKHLLDQALGLTTAQLALMTVLMLRGAQTPGELRARGADASLRLQRGARATSSTLERGLARGCRAARASAGSATATCCRPPRASLPPRRRSSPSRPRR